MLRQLVEQIFAPDFSKHLQIVTQKDTLGSHEFRRSHSVEKADACSIGQRSWRI